MLNRPPTVLLELTLSGVPSAIAEHDHLSIATVSRFIAVVGLFAEAQEVWGLVWFAPISVGAGDARR